jgi:hypothetical protein
VSINQFLPRRATQRCPCRRWRAYRAGNTQKKDVHVVGGALVGPAIHKKDVHVARGALVGPAIHKKDVHVVGGALVVQIVPVPRTDT